MSPEQFSSHGFELQPSELEIFDRFLALFIEYNSHTNLSAIRDPEGIIEKHFVDSLYGASVIDELFVERAEEWKTGTLKLLDIGSGGGFPGIPLGIIYPEIDVTLLDSVGKKVKAMSHFVQELNIANIRAIQARAEVLASDPAYKGKYDIVVSRATAYMTDILTWALPFLSRDGIIVLYKMPSEDESRDIAKICKNLKIRLVAELPYHLAERDRIIYVFAHV